MNVPFSAKKLMTQLTVITNPERNSLKKVRACPVLVGIVLRETGDITSS